MVYLRLGVVVALLLAVVYGLYQCSDESSDPATLAALKTELGEAQTSASGSPSTSTPAATTANSGSPASTAQAAELKQVITQAINTYVTQDYGAMALLTDPATIVASSPAGQPAMTTADYAKYLSQKSDASITLAQTLQALINIQDEIPTISADGTTATYKLKQPVGNISQVVFKKVGVNWCLH